MAGRERSGRLLPTRPREQVVCGPFRGGAFFAVHDDVEVRAYDLGDIRDLLKTAGEAAGR